MYILLWIHIYVHICPYIHMFACVYIHIYMYTCVFANTFSHIYIHIYIYVHINTYIHIYMSIYIQEYMHVHTCVYIYSHTNSTHSLACIFILTLTHTLRMYNLFDIEGLHAHYCILKLDTLVQSPLPPTVPCRLLQCFAGCHSVLQFVVVCSSELQCVAVCSSV